VYDRKISSLMLKPWPIWKYLWKLQLKTNPLVLPIIALLISSIFTSSAYALSNNFAEWRNYTVFDTSTIIDDNIPFIKHTIIIYGIYYLLFCLMALSAPLNKEGLVECILANQILFYQSTLCIFAFLIAPIKVDTRVGLDTGDGLIASFYEILYLADPPYNSWPSLHVVHSIFLTGMFIRWMNSGQGLLKFPKILSNYKKLFSIMMWIICASVIISTMTTKQHYLFDIITGMIVGFGGLHIMKSCITDVESNGSKMIAKFES